MTEEQKQALALEQHIIKVDGLRLHEITEHFRELKRPVQEGISEMIKSKEQLDVVVSENLSSDGSLTNKKSAFGLNRSAVEDKTKL